MPTDLENAWDKGFKTGHASRDAEIRRLKAEIERLKAGVREMEKRALASHSPDILCVCCEWVHRKCDELLKGGGG